MKVLIIVAIAVILASTLVTCDVTIKKEITITPHRIESDTLRHE